MILEKQLMKPKEGYRMKRRLFGKKTYIVFGILCCVMMWLQFGMESYAFTRTTGEVTGSSVKVRKEASTEAELVASVKAGDDLDVVDSVNGADGKVWYKIMISANEYGYIRSDFVTLAGGQQSTNPNTDTGNNTETEVTPMDEQQGHTSTNNVKVRKQAGTTSAEVDRLNQDQIFKITGTAQGTDGKIWYYVSYVDGGASKKGFIRSDLVTIVEAEEPEENQETPSDEVITPDDEVKPNIPAPTTNYEAVYTTDENGQYVWYLYDKTAGQRYKVEQLLNVSKDKQAEIDQLSSDNFGLKIGLIITICLLVMLGVAIAFYIMKMREEQENAGYKRMPQHSSGRPQGSVRTQTPARGQQTTARPQSNVRPQTLTKPQSPVKTAEQTKLQAPAQTTVKTQAQVKTQAKPQAPVKAQEQKTKLSWKAKNFLEDNDEFEFGFLDFDDDDE